MLAWYASVTAISPPPDLAARVLERIGQEPASTPPRRYLAALGALDAGASLRTFRQTLAAALGAGQLPLAVRAQALGLVLLSVLLAGVGGAAGAVGAGMLIAEATRQGPAPETVPVQPSLSPRPSLPPSPSPTLTATPEPSPLPTDESVRPERTREDHTVRPRLERTESPEGSRRPSTRTATPRPSRTSERDDDRDHDEPDETDTPVETAKPEETDALDGGGSGGSDDD
jgi:hypothetical protein